MSESRMILAAFLVILVYATVSEATDTTLVGQVPILNTATYTTAGDVSYIDTGLCAATKVRAVDTTDTSTVSWASCPQGNDDGCKSLVLTEGNSSAPWMSVPHSLEFIRSTVNVSPASGTQSLQVECLKSGDLTGSVLSEAIAVATVGGGSTIVLIGGVGGVADQADPGSPDIVCPTTSANCLYLSTTTGWWGATSSNGTDTTTWEDFAP